MKKYKRWTYEKAKEEALKFSSRTEFQNNAGGCYMYALKNNLLDDICADMEVYKKKWTYQKCIEISKKYEYFKEFRKNSNDAYLAAKRHGWEDEIKATFKKFISKWGDKENVFSEARKYKTKMDFRKGSKGAYEAVYRNGWVIEACEHMKSNMKKDDVIKKEDCIAEAKKYSSPNEFIESANEYYKIAKKNYWLKEAYAHMKNPRTKWDFEKCKLEAEKFKTRNDFQNNSKGAYLWAIKNKYLESVCVNMQPTLTFWDKGKCKKEAKKYKSRTEYSKKNGASYQYALKHNLLDEICKHMETRGNLYKRLIYVYEFNDGYAYIGLTYDEQKRKDEHLIDKRGPVARHKTLTGQNPIYKKLEDYQEVKRAKELEQKYIDEYRNNGWKILNKTKAGALGGNEIYWTFERCKEIAKNFNRKEDLRFAPGLGGLYNAARKRGWWNKICSHMTGGNIHWTKEKCFLESSKYNSLSEFKRKSNAYQAARAQGWIEEICGNMKKK